MGDRPMESLEVVVLLGIVAFATHRIPLVFSVVLVVVAACIRGNSLYTFDFALILRIDNLQMAATHSIVVLSCLDLSPAVFVLPGYFVALSPYLQAEWFVIS